MEILEDRRALVERREETHDESGFAIGVGTAVECPV